MSDTAIYLLIVAAFAAALCWFLRRGAVTPAEREEMLRHVQHLDAVKRRSG